MSCPDVQKILIRLIHTTIIIIFVIHSTFIIIFSHFYDQYHHFRHFHGYYYHYYCHFFDCYLKPASMPTIIIDIIVT